MARVFAELFAGGAAAFLMTPLLCVPFITNPAGRFQVVSFEHLPAIWTEQIFYTVPPGYQFGPSVFAHAFHKDSGYTHSINATMLVKGRFLK